MISRTREKKSSLSFVKAAWCSIVILLGYNGFNLVMDYKSGAARASWASISDEHGD